MDGLEGRKLAREHAQAGGPGGYAVPDRPASHTKGLAREHAHTETILYRKKCNLLRNKHTGTHTPIFHGLSHSCLPFGRLIHEGCGRVDDRS